MPSAASAVGPPLVREVGLSRRAGVKRVSIQLPPVSETRTYGRLRAAVQALLLGPQHCRPSHWRGRSNAAAAQRSSSTSAGSPAEPASHMNTVCQAAAVAWALSRSVPSGNRSPSRAATDRIRTDPLRLGTSAPSPAGSDRDVRREGDEDALGPVVLDLELGDLHDRAPRPRGRDPRPHELCGATHSLRVGLARPRVAGGVGRAEELGEHRLDVRVRLRVVGQGWDR